MKEVFEKEKPAIVKGGFLSIPNGGPPEFYEWGHDVNPKRMKTAQDLYLACPCC